MSSRMRSAAMQEAIYARMRGGGRGRGRGGRGRGEKRPERRFDDSHVRLALDRIRSTRAEIHGDRPERRRPPRVSEDGAPYRPPVNYDAYGGFVEPSIKPTEKKDRKEREEVVVNGPGWVHEEESEYEDVDPDMEMDDTYFSAEGLCELYKDIHTTYTQMPKKDPYRKKYKLLLKNIRAELQRRQQSV